MKVWDVEFSDDLIGLLNELEEDGAIIFQILPVYDDDCRPGVVYYKEAHADIENLANARLIAAAPDMLEALNIAWDNLSQLYPSDHFVIRSINAALAKAKGEI